MKPFTAFKDQLRCAARRGIGWELTFEQWWALWEESGHWLERGKGQGYCMCRNGDVGPYAVGNVSIALSRENSSIHPNRKKSLPMGVFVRRDRKQTKFQARRKIGGKRVELGTFATPEEAHLAYLAAGERQHDLAA
jgi:hypothetical protein